MKNILHIIDTTGPGGAETVFLELVRSTADREVSSVALIRGPGWVQSQLEKDRSRFFVIDCKGTMQLNYLKRLINLIRAEQIDVIQTHLLGSAVYGCMAGLICRKPVICTFHGVVDISPSEKFKNLKMLILRFGAARIIAVTDRLKRVLSSNQLLQEKDIETIYNGIDVSSFSRAESNSLRSKLGISDSFLVGSLGNIRVPKNYPLAIDALHMLHESGVKAHYVIAGQGNTEQLAPLLGAIEKYGLTEYVHILGFVDDVQAFLSSLDVFLMTSSSEGHPLALTQAMSNGLPIVSTPSGIEEIVTHEFEALISDSHEATLIANHLESLYFDTEKRSALGARAKEKAMECYSLDAMIAKYAEVYKVK